MGWVVVAKLPKLLALRHSMRSPPLALRQDRGSPIKIPAKILAAKIHTEICRKDEL